MQLFIELTLIILFGGVSDYVRNAIKEKEADSTVFIF